MPIHVSNNPPFLPPRHSAGSAPPLTHAHPPVFLVKSDKAVPYMSVHQRKGFWNAIRSFFINVPVRDTGDRVIEVKAWPTHLDGAGAMHVPEHGSDTSYKVRPDAVVLATGYRTEFPFLREGQYPTLSEARVRGVYRYVEEGFAYVGFVRPSIGKGPPSFSALIPLYTPSQSLSHPLRSLPLRDRKSVV